MLGSQYITDPVAAKAAALFLALRRSNKQHSARLDTGIKTVRLDCEAGAQDRKHFDSVTAVLCQASGDVLDLKTHLDGIAPQVGSTNPAVLADGHCLIAPVVIRPHYAIGYEAFGQAIFMHLRLFEGIAGSDGEALERDVAACSEMLGQPIFSLAIPDNGSFNSVLSELQFKSVGEIVNHGQTVSVLVREPRLTASLQQGAAA